MMAYGILTKFLTSEYVTSCEGAVSERFEIESTDVAVTSQRVEGTINTLDNNFSYEAYRILLSVSHTSPH